MIRKPRTRLVAVTPGGDAPDGQSDKLSAEMWQRLCVAGERYRDGDVWTWEVLTAASDFVKASGDTARAFAFLSTLPRPPSR